MRDQEKKSRGLAKTLRRRMTDAEVILWSRLRRGGVLGLRFRRQHPIGPYVADFACVSRGLVIEVDGGTHATASELAHDRKRAMYLEARGWRLFRVSNESVYKHLDDVLDGIVLKVAKPPPPSSTAPPP